jgi:MFS family permease
MIKINHILAITFVIAFYMLQMVFRVMPISMSEELVSHYFLEVQNIGFLNGIYYLGYAIFGLIAGICVDLYRPQKIIITFFALCIMGLYITSVANLYYEIIIGRILIGIGSSIAIISVFSVIKDFYFRSFGLFLGLAVCIGMIGANYSIFFLDRLMSSFSNDKALSVLLLIVIVLASGLFAFYHRNVIYDTQQTFSKQLIRIFFDRKLLLIGLFSGLMLGPLEGFASLWGKNYLVQIYYATEMQASKLVNLIYLGFGVGGLCYGALSSKIINISSHIMIMGLGLLLSFGVLMSGILNVHSLYYITFIMGFFSSYQILSFILYIRLKKEKFLISALALINTIIMIFGFVYSFLISVILQIFFIPSTINNLLYSQEAYMAAFSPIIGGIFCGLLLIYSYFKEDKQNV